MGPAVKTIGASAFANTKLTYLDLSEATSLVEIGKSAFSETNLAGTLMIPSTVTQIGSDAFYYTGLTGLDLSKATSLVEIGDRAFLGATNLAGTLAVPNTVTTIGTGAFANTNLDLSKATSPYYGTPTSPYGRLVHLAQEAGTYPVLVSPGMLAAVL